METLVKAWNMFQVNNKDTAERRQWCPSDAFTVKL